MELKAPVTSPFNKITPTTNDRLSGQAEPMPVTFPWPIINPQDQQQAQAEPKPLKVAILGTAPSSRDLAPFKDLSWEIWGTSAGNAMGVLPRVTRWIEIHANLLWPEHKAYGEPYIRWLNEQAEAGAFPIYMQAGQTMVPKALAMPRDELVAKYGRYFFTSTFSWCMALAMEMGAVEIALYGVDMASREEYILQRPGGHHFMQKCAERGIKVIIPPESDLAQPPPLYGYDQATNFGRKLATRELEINARLNHMNAEKAKLEQGIAYLNGAKEDVGYIKDIWGGLDI